MYFSIQNLIRNVIADMEEGDVIKKFNPLPKEKPPRRKPSVQNKSNRTDYMKNYMEKYREEGKDYQKVPPAVKEFRKKQRERLKEKFKIGNIGIGINTPSYEFNVTEDTSPTLILK